MKRQVITFMLFLLIVASAASVNASGLRYDGDGFGPDGIIGMRGDVGRMTMPGMHKSCRTPEYYLDRSEAFGLNSEQEEKMEALYYDLKREMIERGAKVKVLELKLTEIVSKPDFDLDKALDAMKEVEAARTDLRSAVLKAAAAARDMLTPEQLDKAREMKPGRLPKRDRMRDRDGSRNNGGMDEMMRRNIETQMKRRMGAPE